MKNKCFLLIAIIAIVAFSGCKQEPDSTVQRILIVTGIDSKYNTLNATITLTKLPLTEKAEAEATITNGQATFALLLPDSDKPFTEGGLKNPYQATLTILDANGTTLGAYIGVLAVVVLTKETTHVTFSEFIGKGTSG